MAWNKVLRLSAALITSPVAASEFTDVSSRQLPTIIIDAHGLQITNRERWPASMTLISDDSTERFRAEMSIRGSSSARPEKKPYRLELQDENGDDLKLSLLGMPKESDWILHPAYTDKTMIRDVLAYELWRQMGYWAPRTRYVHLFIFTNSSSESFTEGRKGHEEKKFEDDNAFIRLSNSYQGVYVLMEKIKRGKHRVNIRKLPRGQRTEERGQKSELGDQGSVSGGYIFKKDRHNNTNETHFVTSKKVDLLIEEPKAQHLTPEQHAYLTNYINDFEAALFSENFTDLATGYRRYVDIDTFVDYHWMQELAKNTDGYWFSEFYHKDRGGKIRIGPIWDLDMAFGNTRLNKGYLTNEWRWSRSSANHYRWYKRMFKDPDFLQRYIDRWSELRTNVLANSNIRGLIDRYAAEISEAQKLNYQRWPTLSKVVASHFVGQTYEEEVQWLKDWMAGRLAWIDSQDFPKPVLSVNHPLLSASVSSNVSSGFSFSSAVLAMSCQAEAGSIFYTTDGSDPRVPGGHVSTNAVEYKRVIPITAGLQVRARVRSDYGLWSAPAVYP